MTLENKIEVNENSRLKRFLNKIKTKVAPYLLGSVMAITTIPGCGGGGGGSSGGGNKAPVITSTPVTSEIQGNTYQYDVDATDADGDPITYSFAPLPAPQPPAGMSMANPSGMVTWINAGPGGTYNFRIRASDGKGGIATQDVSLNITAITPVVINTKDIDGNGLSSLEVHLYNSTYPKGTYKINSTSGATSNTLSVPAGTYTLEIADAAVPFTSIFTYQQPGIVIPSQGSNFVLGNPEMIKMETINSTNVNHRNSQNGVSFEQCLKYETGTTAADNPSGGPHILRKWPNNTLSSFNICYDISNANTTDNKMADGSAGSNGVPDDVDDSRRAAGVIASGSLVGLTFNETASNPTQGVTLNWVNSITGGLTYLTTMDGYNTDGTYQHATIQIDKNNTNNYIIAMQGICRALWKPGPSSSSLNPQNVVASPTNLYILFGGAVTATAPNSDEQKIFKYFMRLTPGGVGQSTAGVNMDFYKDQ